MVQQAVEHAAPAAMPGGFGLPPPQPADGIGDAAIDRGIRLASWDGVVSQTMSSLAGGVFLVAFALQLGASNLVIGLLAALPYFAQIAQLPALKIVERTRARRRLVVSSLVISRGSLLPVAAAPLLPDPYGLVLLLGAIAVQQLAAAVAACGWNAWMRDLVPADRLGVFFGQRLAYGAAAGLVLSLAGAAFVDAWEKGWFPDAAMGAYGVMFATASLTGLAGLAILARTPEAPPGPARPGGVRRALRTSFAEPNSRRLLTFLALWNFAINMAAPFFAVTMLKVLDLDLATVMALAVLSQLVNLAFLRLAGPVVDRLGSKAVLSVSGALFVACILGWTFTTAPGPYALTLPILVLLHGLMGVATAGVTLASASIAMKVAADQAAAGFLAVRSLMASLAAGIACILGGLFADVFAARELALTLTWREPGRDLAVKALDLTHWDFFFFFAFLVGLVSLKALDRVREGDVARTDAVSIRDIVAETWRSMNNLSTVAGLRRASSYPFGRFLARDTAAAPESPPPQRLNLE